jgi:hypothetical protein
MCDNKQQMVGVGGIENASKVRLFVYFGKVCCILVPMKARWSVTFPFLLFASLLYGAAVPVRLQVALSNTSVKKGESVVARITLVDAHAQPATVAQGCMISVRILDSQTQQATQPLLLGRIAGGQSTTDVKLLIPKRGFFGVRASTTCLRGIQDGLIYLRVASSPVAHSYFVLVAQSSPSPGTIDVFYPQDGNRLVADGQVAASIQVFVEPAGAFRLFFDTAASVSPNPLVFAPGNNGSATASLTSTHSGDFTAAIAASSVPQGYILHTHPPDPPAHHFGPDIKFLRMTASSQKGVPVNSDVNVTVELLDEQYQTVLAEEPVPVALHINPGSVTVRTNPLIIPAGQASNFTSVSAPTAGRYFMDADWADVKSEAPLKIDFSAPIGFWATMLGGLAGASLSCLLRRRLESSRLLQGALAAAGVWLVSGVGLLQNVTAALVSNSFSAAVLGALAGLAGAEVISTLLKALFGVGVTSSEADPTAHSADAGK